MACLALLGLAGCYEGLSTPADMADAFDPTKCAPMDVRRVPYEGAVHLPIGQSQVYKNSPPASGPHWSPAHDWGVYIDQTVPPEWWVHNLEHGGIVFLFNCNGVAQTFNYDLGLYSALPDGGMGDGGTGAMPCPMVAASLIEVAKEKPTGTLVTGYVPTTKRVSAVAWEWIYQSDTVDMAALRCFRDMRWGRGPEKLF